ncbi:cytochrome c biogenesis protein ResB [soil metagenome]
MKHDTVKPLSATQFARWVWRQITSMKTAIMLLLLLALASIPGSLLPQLSVDPQKVAGYRLAHPQLSTLVERLGLFSVYSSVWFSAIYILLMVSLVGCIVPRTGVYFRAVRARPPRAPAIMSRLPISRSFETDSTPEQVLEATSGALHKRRYRVDVAEGEVRAETGYLRELGNLVFHISLLVVIVGVAIGGLYGYRGAVIVTEGVGFSNTITQYDEFNSGLRFNRDSLPQFSLALKDMQARFQLSGPQRGAPRKFEAIGQYSAPGSSPKSFDITVNHPLKIGSTNVYLVGQGYSPVIRIRDGRGKVAFEGAVPFLPTDGSYTSTGVIKVPDARPTQLGFQGFFLPTAVAVGSGPPVSAFPAAANPLLGLLAYNGDLGLDDGTPQSVYVLNKNRLNLITKADGSPLRLNLSPGQTADLPEKKGSIEFVGLRQFARLQIASTPAAGLPLLGTSLGLLGLIVSLMVRPRRLWIKARRHNGRTVVEVAGLSRVSRGNLEAEINGLVEAIRSGTQSV